MGFDVAALATALPRYRLGRNLNGKLYVLLDGVGTRMNVTFVADGWASPVPRALRSNIGCWVIGMSNPSRLPDRPRPYSQRRLGDSGVPIPMARQYQGPGEGESTEVT